MEKTNVIRLLEQKKIPYTAHTYEADATKTGEEIAALLNEDAERVFKTLVAQGKSGAYYVFVIPVNAELDLKKAALASGEKSVSMIRQKELLSLTGYVHGGCSPIGMKKQFPTFFHETASGFEKIYFSAGKVGYQVEVSPEDLKNILRFEMAELV
ncbi:MAG: Cys-tRNA(Pro) deacylase [Lachnospiraceae bacterium]|nr:Cys-tRNA(Pro) deacylase [Lachnospiraceae bacterium]